MEDVNEALKIMNFALNNNAEAVPQGSEENQRTYETSSSNNINDSSNPDPDNNALVQSKENTKKRSASMSDDSGNDGMMMGE